MSNTLQFGDEEAALLLELLEAERTELPVEIRRTDNPRVHDELQERMKMVDALIERLQHAGVH